MHEMAIAQSIIEIVEREARKHNSGCVKRVKVQIGEFSGVVREALEFSFEVAKSGTIAENAELEVEVIGFKAKCKACNFEINGVDDFNLFCPNCGEPMEIVSGREMRVEYIEIE